MAAIGSGINPALGRVDYSPFLQGAQMAAQGRIQGSNALAEGVSQGFQDYLKKREQNAILEGKNNALLRDIAQNPGLSSNPEIQKYTAKMAKGGGLTLNDNIKLNAELTTAVEAARMRQEEKRQQDYLQLQRDAAAINAARAQREKDEYERKNRFQSRMIAGLRANPKALNDPDLAMQLVISNEGTLDDARSVFGDAVRIQDYARNKEIFDLDKKRRELEIQRLKTEQEPPKADGDLFEVQEVDGVRVAIFYDKFKNIIGREVIKAEPPSQGQKLRSEASKYYAALNSGNTAAAAEAVANARRLTAGQKFENYEDDEFAKKVFGPFQGDLGETPDAGPQEKLVIKGGVKPVSPTPSPTAEDRRITQSPSQGAGGQAGGPASPMEMRMLNAPASELVNEGRQWLQGQLGANAEGVSDAVKARFTSIFGPYGSSIKGQVSDDDALSAYVDQMRKGFSLTDRDPLSGLMQKSGGATQSANPYGTGSGAFRNLNLGGPPSRGAQPLIPQSIESSSIPFGPAAMDSTFLDREAQATDRGAYRPFDAAMAERYQTPAQGAIPQIKLSPAAQKIASELRKSAQSGERGKAPQFFLEASTGDNGKRTRVKLDRNELFAILTNNPMPNLSPTLEVDREETRRLMDQQMRMNELMRQYRPPARRAR